MNEAKRQLLHDSETLGTIKRLYEGSLLTDGILANLLGCEPGKFVQPEVKPVEDEEQKKRARRGTSTSKSAEYNRRWREKKKAELALADGDSDEPKSEGSSESAVSKKSEPAEDSDEVSESPVFGPPKPEREPVAAEPSQTQAENESLVNTDAVPERKKPGRRPGPRANSGKLAPADKTVEGIDAGKVLALHRAGWPMKDIASDMHIELEDVRKVLASRA